MIRAARIAALSLCLTPTWALAAMDAKEELRIRKITFDYARCVAQSHHDLASRAIVSDENNATIMRRYGELIDGACLGRTAGSVQVSFGGDLYRYALADALVNQDFAKTGPSSFDDRLPLAQFEMPDRAALDAELGKTKSASRRREMEEGYGKRLTTAWLSRYGECVARQDPTGSRLWLLTPPGGPEEVSRINALRPAFASFLAGTQTFNRTTMRGTVALNYYRLAMATAMPAAGKAN